VPTPIHIYRPQRTFPEDLEVILVGREPLLQEVLGRLQHWTPGASRQHYLLIGPRGIGKTCLLVLIEHRIRRSETLRKKWAPVLFAEDAYKITSVADLLLEALHILAEQTVDPELSRVYERLRFDGQESRVVDLSLDAFRRFHHMSKQGVLLMVENVDRILEKQMRRPSEVHLLRKILTEEGWLLTVCTSPTYLDAVTRAEEPFFEFFQVKLLAELTQEEQELMLRKKAALEGNTGFEAYLEKYRSRIQALYHFTGGNPRLAVMLYDVVANHNITDVATELDLLLDQLTPFYQHRMSDLAEQERKVLETMALLPEGCTPTELAKHSRIPAKITRAHLTRLERAGYVRREERRRKRTVYIIPERFFRIWHQMNNSRAARGRIQYLLEFFTSWYATRWERDQVWKELTAKFEQGLDASDADRINELDEYMGYIMDLSRGRERWEREFDRLRSLAQVELPEAILSALELLDDRYGADADYLRYKGYFLAKDLGMHEAALEAFHAASLLNKADLENLFNYAYTLDRTGRQEEASEMYWQVARLLTKRKGKKGVQEVEALLLEILREGRGKALRMAAWLLGRTGSASIASRIAGVLSVSANAASRLHCATALGLLGAEEEVPTLLKCLRDKTPKVRGSAATALGRIGAPQAVDALLHCLQDTDPFNRGSAATALGRIGAPQAVDALIRCLQDPDPAVRGGAASALGRIGASQAVDALIHCLQDLDPANRGSAATALGRIGVARAVEPLTRLLQDFDFGVRRSAEIALTHLASEHSDPSLVQVIAGGFRDLVLAPRSLRVLVARVLLRSAFRSNDLATIRNNFELVTSELGDSGGMWVPYDAALRYLESNRDPAVLDQQNPEMREAIELLVGVPADRPLRAAS
jgi:DNA-binding MarR family transcriptional regulator